MSSELTTRDREQIYSGIREKYIKVATNPGGHFTYPTGREGLKGLKYDANLIETLPDAVADSYCGVGNPISLGKIDPGLHVLDIGCGTGVDALLAARLVGDSGKVVGIDLTPEMIHKARSNQKEVNSDNIEFQVSSVQDLANIAEQFDIVISNGVFNLIPDKNDAVKAVLRLLKPGGRFFLADQFLVGQTSKDLKERVASWFQWEGGAIPEKDFLALLNEAGFEKIEHVAETGYNSSPKTKGMLVRARKPEKHSHNDIISLKPGAKEPSDRMSDKTKLVRLNIEGLLKRALHMGASKAKIIDADSIVVEKWVKWKCIYGCPMYGKDGYHPPMTPDLDEVREVLGEYARAILLNSDDGKLLTEVACRLEGEAYHMGYYKAFAMTALSVAASSDTAKPGDTWPSGAKEAPCEAQESGNNQLRVRPMLEACGIDVFKTARRNGFEIDTRKEKYGKWNFFAMVLIE